MNFIIKILFFYFADLLTSDFVKEINGQTDPSNLIKCWDKHHKPRQNALKNVTSPDVYIRSFTCLNSEIGKILIQSDFNQLYKNKDPNNSFYNIFEQQWPTLSKDLLTVFINGRKTREEVNNFMVQFDDILETILSESEYFYFSNLKNI